MKLRRLITITCLSLATVASAQQSTPAPATQAERATAPVTAETDQDVNNPNALRISLNDAVVATVKQNLGIDIQRYDYAMSGEQLAGSWGVFDPIAGAVLNHSSSNTAPTNATDASSSRSTTADVSLSQFLPTGGDYSIGFNNRRFTSAGGSTTLSPGYASGLDFGLTQPLARNFGIDINRRNITIARNNLGISNQLFRDVLLTTVNNVEQAYDDLVYSRSYVDVVKEAVFLARDQARITQIRIDVGASAPLDILQPRVQIATSEQQLIAAIASVRNAEDRLRQLMNLPQSEWNRPIIPTDNVTYAPMNVDVDASVARAYTLRPEIKEQELTTANRRVQYLFARNQILPQFDAKLGYNTSGAAGTINDNGTLLQNTGYTQALTQVLQNKNPGWNVGVTIGVPIFNISARAEARRAELDLQQSQVITAQTRQNIAVDVRGTARAIDTAAKEIAASRTAREAAERNLEAERKRYENGMTTNFQVLQVQQQLSDARASELQALVGYAKAVAAYHRAVGDLLDIHHITVDVPPVEVEHPIFTRLDRYNWLNYGNTIKGDEQQR